MPSDPELCESPWGGDFQYCRPVRKDGTCSGAETKCSTADGDAHDYSGYTSAGPCLCAFDIDRTLTAKQGSSQQGNSSCSNSTRIEKSRDSAFGGGVLTLGAAGSLGIAQTACRECYIGIVSAGAAAGTTKLNRAKFVQAITTTPFAELLAKHQDASSWSYGGFGKGGQRRITSPLVVKQPNSKKQYAVQGILDWYASKGISIDHGRVFFFDDLHEREGFQWHWHECTSNRLQ